MQKSQYEKDLDRLALFRNAPFEHGEKCEDGSYLFRFMQAPDTSCDTWLRNIWLKCQFVILPTWHPRLVAFALEKGEYGGMGPWGIGTFDDMADAIDGRLTEFAGCCRSYAGWPD